MTTNNHLRTIPVEEMLEQLSRIMASVDGLPPEDSPQGRVVREQRAQNWISCRDGLLARTKLIDVWPEPTPYPRTYHIKVHRPFKQKLGPDAPVTLAPGPIRGVIIYRPELLTSRDEQPVAVRLDPTLGYLHPNFSRRFGLLCLGRLPPGLFPLDALLEHHIYPILTYQNRSATDPADLDAAHYFATDPDAMTGLEPVPPLY